MVNRKSDIAFELPAPDIASKTENQELIKMI
jgi:hypothetical protein